MASLKNQPNTNLIFIPTPKQSRLWCLYEDLSFYFSESLGIYELIRPKQWHPTPVLLPGESHGQRSQVGCSPWGRWESDTTEQLPFNFSLSFIGEGNGNPLQCSCLEESQGQGSLVGFHLWGHTESDTTGLSSSSSKQSEMKVAQLCPTLCDPMDCSPPGSSVHGILQARILEWVAIDYTSREFLNLLFPWFFKIIIV